MIARNRELARTLALWLALAIGAALAGNALAGLRGAALGIGAAMAAAVPFLILTYRRYRALRTMAGNLDAVLHGERELSFDRMDEGELAVLASELDKMVLRLTLTADDLAAERTRLADALADISHQLKTPLTALSLTTELVRKDLSADGARPQTVERLRQIEALEMRVEDLVSTLLRLAQLDAGALAFAREPVAVASLTERAAAPLAIAFDLADVELVQDIEDGASFAGDAAWTTEALGNVLKNCLEHTPAGGRVTVSAREDLIACRIRVTDTGPGIAEADLPHIFERFYRGSAASADRGEKRSGGSPAPDGAALVIPAGVGIGLSLARALVTAQGGTLTAENARDASGAVTGALFTFTFFKDVAV